MCDGITTDAHINQIGSLILYNEELVFDITSMLSYV